MGVALFKMFYAKSSLMLHGCALLRFLIYLGWRLNYTDKDTKHTLFCSYFSANLAVSNNLGSSRNTIREIADLLARGNGTSNNLKTTPTDTFRVEVDKRDASHSAQSRSLLFDEFSFAFEFR